MEVTTDNWGKKGKEMCFPVHPPIENVFLNGPICDAEDRTTACFFHV